MKFKTSTLNPSLCDFSDAYIFVSGAITVVGGNADDAGRVVDRNRNDKQKIFKNCAPFVNCITEINSTQVDNTKYFNIVFNKIQRKLFQNIWKFILIFQRSIKW